MSKTTAELSDVLVSIITVNYNQPEFTLQLLKSLQSINFKDFEIIVVDNGSNEDPKQEFLKQFPTIHYIRSAQNLGFAGGNNLGIQASKGAYLFFVNNDARVMPGAIPKLLDIFQHIPNLGIVSPLICFDPVLSENPNQDIIQFAGATKLHPLTARNRTIGRLEVDKGQFNQPYPIAYVHGAAMMIPRTVMDQVGLMYEDYFLYYEELDWCERIRKAGYAVYLEPRAKVYHAESITTGKNSPLKTYYLNRNRILFMRRNYSYLSLWGFCTFFIFVTIPKHVLTYISTAQWEHLTAFRKAIWWHILPNRIN